MQVLHPSKLKLLHEAGWLILGQVSTLAASLYAVRILTGYLGPEQYGNFALGLTIAALVNQVVFGGLSNGIARYFVVAAEKRNLGGYFNASLQIITKATSLILFLGFFVIAGIYYLDYVQWLGLGIVVLIYSVLNGFSSTVSAIQNTARQRLAVVFSNGFDSWAKIACAVGCLTMFGGSGAAVILGYIASSFLTICLQFHFLSKSFGAAFANRHNSSKWSKEILNYSQPFLLWGGFTWLQQCSDRWALMWFSSSNEVGLYAALSQIGYAPISLGIGVLMSFLAPIFYGKSGDGNDHKRNTEVKIATMQILVFCLLITFLGFILAFKFHELIFEILVAPTFKSVSYFLPWMILAGGVFAAGQIISLQLMSDMKTVVMTNAKIYTALMGSTLNIIGAYLFGILGIVIAQITFSFIYFLWMMAISDIISISKFNKNI